MDLGSDKLVVLIIVRKYIVLFKFINIYLKKEKRKYVVILMHWIKIRFCVNPI